MIISWKHCALTCLFLFILAASLSFLNTLQIGYYNGDFLGVKTKLNSIELFFVFLFTVIPFFILFFIYSIFSSREYKVSHDVEKNKIIGVFFVVFILWSFFVTIFYDVGIMVKGSIQAPFILSLLIQLTNRIDPFYLGVLFLLGYKGRFIYFFIAALCLLGLLRAGIGVFLYVGMALIIRNNIKIFAIFKKRPVLSIFIILVMPFFINFLYMLRSEIRGEDAFEMLDVYELIVGKLFGRFSSFSNLAMIMQEDAYFSNLIQNLDSSYYIQQALAVIFGKDYISNVSPEIMLINIFGGDLVDKSYMVGIAGHLWITSNLSLLFTAVNVGFILFVTVFTFLLSRWMKVKNANEYALIILFYPMVSGAALEFSKLLFSVLLISIVVNISFSFKFKNK